MSSMNTAGTIRLLGTSLLLTTVVGWGSNLTAAEAQPNILLVAVDDMGYSDIGPFGGEIRTPSA